MKDDQILIEVARLDGKEAAMVIHLAAWPDDPELLRYELQEWNMDYLNSRDALSSVISKLTCKQFDNFTDEIALACFASDIKYVLLLPPRLIAISLLKSVGKFREE